LSDKISIVEVEAIYAPRVDFSPGQKGLPAHTINQGLARDSIRKSGVIARTRD
jgi:hypothetical protein